MFLGYDGIGMGLLTSAIPSPQEYNSLTFYGEAWLDNVSLLQELPTTTLNLIDGEVTYSDTAEGNASLLYIDGEIVAVVNNSLTNALTTLDYSYDGTDFTVTVPEPYVLEKEQTWIDYINMMLANFEDSLEGGNISNSELPITEWRILRRLHGATQYTELATVSNNNAVQYIDIYTRSNRQYDYALQAISNDIYGILVSKEGITLSFYGWKISDLTGKTTFSFDAEIQTGDIKSTRKISQMDNYSQFPVINQGKQKYDVIPISCIPYAETLTYDEYDEFPETGTMGKIYLASDTGLKYIWSSGEYTTITNNFIVDDTVLEPIKTFMEDGTIKILRNGSGRAWQVFITDFSYKYMDEIANSDSSQPYTISFTATQVGAVTE